MTVNKSKKATIRAAQRVLAEMLGSEDDRTKYTFLLRTNDQMWEEDEAFRTLPARDRVDLIVKKVTS